MADTRFLGTGWAFPPSFERFGGGLAAGVVSGEADIRESLRILLSTAPGERVMQPEYGCGLRRMVFGHLDESAITAIKDVVAVAVLRHEVRVVLDEVKVETDELAEGVLRLRLDYRVRSTNSRANMVYPYHVPGAA